MEFAGKFAVKFCEVSVLEFEWSWRRVHALFSKPRLYVVMPISSLVSTTTTTRRTLALDDVTKTTTTAKALEKVGEDDTPKAEDNRDESDEGDES